jgi:hypothetical protein
MKINLKHSLGKFGQHNIRLPLALKQRLDKSRAFAEELGVDFTATEIDNLEQFETELAAQLKAVAAKRAGEAKPSGPGPANGIIRTNGNESDHG